MPPRLPRLPGILQEIAAAAGLQAALAVARHLGGRRLSIPAGPVPDDHPLRLAVDRQAAKRIGARLGAGRHFIPRARAYVTWAAARMLRSRGDSIAQIAATVGVSETRIKELVTDIPRGGERTDTFAGPNYCPLCGRTHRRPGKKATPPAADERQAMFDFMA